MSQMLYRHPGEHILHGISCDYRVVDEMEVVELLDSGEWHLSPSEALFAAKSKELAESKTEPELEAVKVTKKKVTKKKAEC